MNRFTGIVFAGFVGILIAGGVAFAGESYVQAATTMTDGAQTAADLGSLDATVAITNDCRYGVAGWQTNYLDWIGGQNVGIGWEVDFSAHSLGNRIPGAEYAQVIKVLQHRTAGGVYSSGFDVNPPLTEAGLGALIGYNRGYLWMVGNEPDRGPINPASPNRVQDDTFPEVYATAYHDIYAFIKSHDPTAQVANAGLVEVTPGRLQYLETVWTTYLNNYGTTMPVDVWNMHIYVLPEANHLGTLPNNIASVAKGSPLATALKEGTYTTNALGQSYCTPPGNVGYYCTAVHDSIPEFGKQVTAMRAWMAEHGQQSKPLILSEFGLLYPYDPAENPSGCWVYDEFGKCFTPTRVANFLTDSFNYLNTTTDPILGDPLDNNRMVQQWLWFSLNNDPNAGHISDLVSGTAPAFTTVGQAFRTAAQAMPQTINLSATNSLQFVSLNVVGDQMSVTVKVGVINNGSIRPGVPAKVTAYSDAARTLELGSGYLYDAPGCARRETFANVSLTLPAAPTGLYTYYLRIDPGNPLGETTMLDNDLQGTLNLTPTRVLLPLIAR